LVVGWLHAGANIHGARALQRLMEEVKACSKLTLICSRSSHRPASPPVTRKVWSCTLRLACRAEHAVHAGGERTHAAHLPSRPQRPGRSPCPPCWGTCWDHHGSHVPYGQECGRSRPWGSLRVVASESARNWGRALCRQHPVSHEKQPAHHNALFGTALAAERGLLHGLVCALAS
jgi:hypothetical protein